MRYTLFGESHGPVVGVVVEGLPAGLTVDMDFIQGQMARRRPGQDALSSARQEPDMPEILSGVYRGKTTGTPLCAIVRNRDTRPGDYETVERIPRPSHGDYAALVRYGGFADLRGGGHHSGRLTAPLVFAGALAQLWLKEKGISVCSHVARLAGVNEPDCATQEGLIAAAKADGDSVGGIIRCTVEGLPAGFGGPDWEQSTEGIIAQQLFAIPGVKGVSFGAGFGFADMRGSEANDPFYQEGQSVKTRTNHSGGINGGITNGMPLVVDLVLRPTPSIARPQTTLDLAEGTQTELRVSGRHDPCIVRRALPVAEGALALAVCRLLELGKERLA